MSQQTVRHTLASFLLLLLFEISSLEGKISLKMFESEFQSQRLLSHRCESVKVESI